MKEVQVTSRTTPAKPRSGNYPVGTVIQKTGGTTVVQGGEGGQGIDIVKTGETTSFTDENVLSSKRSQEEFISRKNDSDVNAVVNFLKGLKINGKPFNELLTAGAAVEGVKDEALMSAARVLKEIMDRALSKTKKDQTEFLVKFLGGAIFKTLTKFGDFVTGVSGGIIQDNGEAELESLLLRGDLKVNAIRYNYMTYFMGYNLITPGGGLKIKEFTDNGDGTWTVTPDLEEGMPCGQYVDDILLGYWYDKNEQTGDFAGFRKMQFRVMSVDYDTKTFIIAPRPGSNSVPYKQMKLGQTGNISNTERQTYMILDVRDGNNCITFYDNANTWDPEPAQIKSWFGKKKGMTVAGINCDNYSAVLQNILMTGLIFQIDEITGDAVRVPIDKGSWSKGKYAYYNRVSHNGALWLCVATEGTEEEPGTGIAWLKQVSEGAKGDPGLSVVGGGHWESANVPYKKNQQVNFSHGSFVAVRDTSEPPLAISRFNNGKYRRTTRGYILAGRSQDMAVHADWQMVAWTDPSIVYRLDCPVTAFSYTSTGSLSPSSVEVTCRQINGQESSLCSSLYLVGRRYNGSTWAQFISPTQANKVSVTPAAGYTQFTVRAYKSSSDASAWNNNYVAELGIGVAERGIDGKTLGFLYDCGVFQSGKSYVWNSDRRDKVIYKIENTYYNFLVKNFGSTVTAAPTSATGDSNWEALQKFASIVTDTFFADGANIAGLMFKLTGYTEAGIPVGEIRSQNTGTDGQPVLSCNTLTGKFVCQDADITGTIRATDGYFRGVVETAASGKRIVINPATNSFKMIDAGNKELVSINFSSIEGYDVGLIRMDAFGSGKLISSTDVSPTHISITGPLGTTMLTNRTILVQDASSANSLEFSPTKINIKSSNTQYVGRSTTLTLMGGGTYRFINGILVE
jgi:hypothetical protein